MTRRHFLPALLCAALLFASCGKRETAVDAGLRMQTLPLGKSPSRIRSL